MRCSLQIGTLWFALIALSCGRVTSVDLVVPDAPDAPDAASPPVPAEAVALTLSLQPADVEVGARSQVVVVAHFSDQTTIELNEQRADGALTIDVEAPAIASLDGAHVVGVAPGSTEVRAAYRGLRAQAVLQVFSRPDPPAALQWTPASIALQDGESSIAQLSRVLESGARQIVSADARVTFEATGPIQFVVAQDGIEVLSAGIGAAELRATLDGLSAVLSVVVHANPRLAIEAPTLLPVEATRPFRVVLHDDQGPVALDVDAPGLELEALPAEVIAIEGDRVAGLAAGEATIAARWDGLTALAHVTVFEDRTVEVSAGGPYAPGTTRLQGTCTWGAQACPTTTLRWQQSSVGALGPFVVTQTATSAVEFEPGALSATWWQLCGCSDTTAEAECRCSPSVEVGPLPLPSVDAGLDAQVDEFGSFTVLATCATCVSFEWAFNGQASAGDEATFVVADGPATDRLTLTGCDRLGRCAQDTAVVMTNNVAPTFTTTPPTRAVITETWIYQGRARDPANTGGVIRDPLTWTLVQAPEGMTVSADGRVEWVPGGYIERTERVTLRVSDGDGARDQTWTLNVDFPTGVCNVNAGPDRVLDEGTEFVLAGASWGCDPTDPTSRTWDIDPPRDFEVLGPDATFFARDGPEDSRTVTFRGCDVYRRCITDGVVVTVRNVPPTITSAPTVTATIGRSYTYQATATDPANAGGVVRDPLTWTLVLGPTGMTVARSTGLLSWTPPPGLAGPIPVQLRVHDGQGSTVQDWMLQLTAP